MSYMQHDPTTWYWHGLILLCAGVLWYYMSTLFNVVRW